MVNKCAWRRCDSEEQVIAIITIVYDQLTFNARFRLRMVKPEASESTAVTAETTTLASVAAIICYSVEC